MADIDDTIECPVCFEFYEVSGDHIPRILHCFHTLCEKCVRRLLNNKKMECPQCRAKHSAPEEVKSFPQNKYIISTLRKNSKLETCKTHKRELCAFCLNPECRKPICYICLARDHAGHNMTDFLGLKENLTKQVLEKATKLERSYFANEETLKATVKLLEEKKDNCVDRIKKRKDELMKLCDGMMQDAVDHVAVTIATIDEDLMGINQNILKLKKIKNDARCSKFNELINSDNIVSKMASDDGAKVPDFGKYHYPVYVQKPTADGICGKLTQMKFNHDEIELLSKNMICFIESLGIYLQQVSQSPYQMASWPITMLRPMTVLCRCGSKRKPGGGACHLPRSQLKLVIKRWPPPAVPYISCFLHPRQSWTHY